MKDERFRQIHPRGLPIFESRAGHKSIVYAPGHLAVMECREVPFLRECFEKDQSSIQFNKYLKTANSFEGAAVESKAKFKALFKTEYKPECLAIGLGNRCNLECIYCYSRRLGPESSHRHLSTALSLNMVAINSASELIAETCTRKGRHFCLVIQGPGEPTQNPDIIEAILSSAEAIAEKAGLEIFKYISTNGVMSSRMAQYLARKFSRVGISCDGPGDIQDGQRPLIGGRKSSGYVERTARIIMAEGGQVSARATITSKTLERQIEIVEYLHNILGAKNLRFEIAYRMQNNVNVDLGSEQAECFVRYFLLAQGKARELGCELSFSGVRPDEIHGQYCNILRDVLFITIGGAALACSIWPGGTKHQSSPYTIGHYDEKNKTYIIHNKKVTTLRQKATIIPPQCMKCVNIYHCARECPDNCVLMDKVDNHLQRKGLCELYPKSLRCQIQRLLAEEWIFRAAEPLLLKKNHQSGNGLSKNILAGSSEMLVQLKRVESQINIDEILSEFESLEKPFCIESANLPLPIWATRGFVHNGKKAWQILSDEKIAESFSKAISIYIHVPFCDRRCGFCNSFSVPVHRNNGGKAGKYEQRLLRDINLWSELKVTKGRPVTTIHFGGGTPNFLEPAIFEAIVNRCKSHFNVSSKTEWALESTSSLLSDKHLDWLRELGFSRLHVGVQTLEDPVRKTIGRREASQKVIYRLSRALQLGFIVSADIMYGLPNQSIPGLLSTLKQLDEIGIHGISLYGLHITSRNRRFLSRHGINCRNMLKDYVFAQVAEQCLLGDGYRKIHFTHFARPENQNLYYSFPVRGEDLVALGPSADGVFSGYHYRHSDYRKYMDNETGNIPLLDGGIYESAIERKFHRATVELMASFISASTVREYVAEELLELWLRCDLLQKTQRGDSYMLTANGSWFINDMIRQLLKHGLIV